GRGGQTVKDKPEGRVRGRFVARAPRARAGLGGALVLLRAGSGSPSRGRGSPPPAARTAADPSMFATEQARIRVVTLTKVLVEPWALAFLPEGDILVTERGGRLRLVQEGGATSAVIGDLPPVDTRAQDGLMDLALHPLF